MALQRMVFTAICILTSWAAIKAVWQVVKQDENDWGWLLLSFWSSMFGSAAIGVILITLHFKPFFLGIDKTNLHLVLWVNLIQFIAILAACTYNILASRKKSKHNA